MPSPQRKRVLAPEAAASSEDRVDLTQSPDVGSKRKRVLAPVAAASSEDCVDLTQNSDAGRKLPRAAAPAPAAGFERDVVICSDDHTHGSVCVDR